MSALCFAMPGPHIGVSCVPFSIGCAQGMDVAAYFASVM
jgi:hypothetical protein